MRRHHLLALVLPLIASCSLVFVRAPDPNPPCTDDYVLPVVDGVVGAGSLLSTLLVAVACSVQGDPTDRTSCHATEAGLGAAAALLVTSSIIGSRRVQRCKTAQAAVTR